MNLIVLLCIALIVANIGPAHVISEVTGDYKDKEPVEMVRPKEHKEGEAQSMKEAVDQKVEQVRQEHERRKQEQMESEKTQ